MKLVPIFESTSMVECCECQTSFDYNSIPESGMGYVKCPNCDKPVTQGSDVIEKDGRYSMDNGSYADIEKMGDEWYIEYIESKKQRKGDGTKIINKIIHDAKEQGVKIIGLQTGEGTAYGFAKKLGFKEVGENKDRDNISMELAVEQSLPTQEGSGAYKHMKSIPLFEYVSPCDTSEKNIVDVDKHKGTMHKLLGIPGTDKVRDHYPTGTELAKALHGKASRQKLQSLLNYAANINGNADDLFRDASDELKKLYKN